MSIKQTILPLLLIGLFACQEPYDFGATDESLLVVDGRVSTEVGESYFFITEAATAAVRRENLNGYTVSVISSMGDSTTFSFDDTEEITRYSPNDPSFVGVAGLSYSAYVVTPEGYRIRSGSDLLPALSDFDLLIADTTINTVVDDQIVPVERAQKVEVSLAPETENYYALFRFSWGFAQPFSPGCAGSCELEDIREASCFWERENDDDYLLYRCLDQSACGQTSKLLVDMFEYPVWFFRSSGEVPVTLNCPLYPVAVELRHQALSPETYEYWSDVSMLLSNDGLVFDIFPFEVEGNISCENCPFNVVGKFSAFSERIERDTLIL